MRSISEDIDIFGRENPRVKWTDVPEETYQRLMSMDKEEREKILDEIDLGSQRYSMEQNGMVPHPSLTNTWIPKI